MSIAAGSVPEEEHTFPPGRTSSTAATGADSEGNPTGMQRLSLVKCLLASIGAALAITAVTANAAAAGPGFTHPWKVARAMEAHYNSADFKRRLGKYGWQNVGKVLCAPDDASPDKVDCSGRQRFRANGKWVPVQSGWSLRKLSATRARFSWWWEGRADGDSGDEIVSPAAFELTRF